MRRFDKKYFYVTLSGFWLAGVIWISLAAFGGNYIFSFWQGCVMKMVWSLPCPSCGSTTAAVELINGNILTAFVKNPIGPVLLIGLSLLPFWLLYDAISSKQTLYNASHFLIEKAVRNKLILIGFFLFILLIWLKNLFL